MNIGIAYALTKIVNSNNNDIAKINNFCNELVNSINSHGIKTISFNKIDEKNLKLAEEKIVSSINSIEMDLCIFISFDKEDTTLTGSYAYAISEEEKIIANNVLNSISSVFKNNGVRQGKKQNLLRNTNSKSIILTPYNLISDIEQLNKVGINYVANIIALSIVNSIK